MKKLSGLIIIVFLIAFVFVSCSEDATTELAWTNNSDDAINTISWANDDAIWATVDGYEGQGVGQTGSKEVSVLTGEVTCYIWTAGAFQEAGVVVDEFDSEVITLEEGESYMYGLTATAKK